MQMANECMKTKPSALLISRETQIKPTVRQRLTPERMTIFQKKKSDQAGRDKEEEERTVVVEICKAVRGNSTDS
jgi:hypothetical protein